MKLRNHSTFAILFFLAFGPTKVAAQCPPGNLVLNNQAAVDDFAAAYPDCTELPGDLRISSQETITDLTPLAQLTSVTGKIHIESLFNDLSLEGLENIQSARSLIIGHDFSFSTSPSVWYGDFAPLGNISGHLDSLFLGYSFLESFGTEFPGVTSVGYLRIMYNPSLTSIPSFPALEAVRDFTVSVNEVLEHIEIPENITTVDFAPGEEIIWPMTSGIYIQANPMLETVNCDPNLSSLRQLIISGNDALSNISGFSGLDTIHERLRIQGKVPSIFNCLNSVSYVNYVEMELDAEGVTEPFAEMYVGLGENVSALEIGADFSSNTGLSISAPMILSLVIAGPIVSCEGGMNFSGTFHTLSSQGFIQEIGGNLLISSPFLTELPDMPQLTTVGGNLQLSLPNIGNLQGLNALTSVSGSLELTGSLSSNSGLESLAGLNMLAEVGGNFRLQSHPLLTDVQALEQLSFVGGSIWLLNLPALTNEGISFPNLTGSGGLMIINVGLAGIPDMPEYSQVYGNLWLMNNPILSETDAFQNLTSITGSLTISGNPMLGSVLFSPDLDFSGEFTLTDNTALGTCNAPAVCMLIDLAESVTVESNGAGCTSLEEVTAGCLVNTRNTARADRMVYQSLPGELMVSLERNSGNSVIRLFDIQGRQHHAARTNLEAGTNAVSIPRFAKGIYVVQIDAADGVSSHKLRLW